MADNLQLLIENPENEGFTRPGSDSCIWTWERASWDILPHSVRVQMPVLNVIKTESQGQSYLETSSRKQRHTSVSIYYGCGRDSPRKTAKCKRI
jgi:hypothetical protein